MKLVKTADCNAQKGLVLSGIFGVFLLLGLVSAFIYSPVFKSHADSNNTQTDVKVNVDPVIAIRTNIDELNLSANVGDFTSGTVNVDVATNSQYGHTLTLEDADSNTNMTSATSSDVLSSNFSGSKTSSTMDDNTWGYSLDNTNFYKVPAKGDYARLRNTSAPSPTNPGYERTPVYFGAKVGMYLTAGTYEDTVKFTAYVNGQDGEPILPMQDFKCSSLSNVGDSATVADTRDNNIYVVRKLADGNCWMTENLRIQNKSLTDADTDLLGGETFTITESKLSDFITAYNEYNVSAVYVDKNFGGYYDFYAATAGWGTTGVRSGDSPKSICPKNWKLPAYSDYQNLRGYYDSSAQMHDSSFTFSGYVYNGILNNSQNDYSAGYYWSSTARDTSNAYELYINKSMAYAGDNLLKYYGFSVRCMARL